MYERIKNRVRELLASGEIEGFLALKAEGTHQMPYLFTNPDANGRLKLLSHGTRSKPIGLCFLGWHARRPWPRNVNASAPIRTSLSREKRCRL
jgi:hypothetical protein